MAKAAPSFREKCYAGSHSPFDRNAHLNGETFPGYFGVPYGVNHTPGWRDSAPRLPQSGTRGPAHRAQGE
ncbi:hypothetical protein GCM10010214_46050 [Streptomyces abikoensis]|nr:hypothetical protein GCM10010214_46050 [Streptomyces abikoensis]